jgi:hypothetical protein
MSRIAGPARVARAGAPSADSPDRALRRSAAVLLLAGALAQVPLALLHPHRVDPNDSAHVFEEYSASTDWQVVHLGQFLGALVLVLGLVVAARTLAGGRGAAGPLALLAQATALVVAAVFAVQMAVDGVALKAAVDAWQAAPSGEADAAFRVADSVRSIEKGLSALFNLTNGVTVLLLSAAVLLGRRLPAWIGLVGAVAGSAFLALGVVTASSGFSPEASSVALVATVAAPVFVVALAVALWRADRAPVGSAGPGR